MPYSPIRKFDASNAVIPGGVDAEWFSPGTAPADRNGFAYVGRVLPHKRLERAVAALPAGARVVDTPPRHLSG